MRYLISTVRPTHAGHSVLFPFQEALLMGIIKQRREEAERCEADQPVGNGSEPSPGAPTMSATQRANVSTISSTLRLPQKMTPR